LSPARFDQLLVQALVSHALRELPSAFDAASAQSGDVAAWIASRLPMLQEAIGRARPRHLLPLFDSAQSAQPNQTLINDRAPAAWSSASAFRPASRADLALFTAPDSAGHRKLFLYRADHGIELPIELADSLESLIERAIFTFDQMTSALRAAKPLSDFELHEIVDALVELGAIAPSHEE
jgi:hypothetical protein